MEYYVTVAVVSIKEQVTFKVKVRGGRFSANIFLKKTSSTERVAHAEGKWFLRWQDRLC